MYNPPKPKIAKITISHFVTRPSFPTRYYTATAYEKDERMDNEDLLLDMIVQIKIG